MNENLLYSYEKSEIEGVITFKNKNTTIGFIRFNSKGEVEYIFVNPAFRKKGFAKKLLKFLYFLEVPLYQFHLSQ